MLSVWLRFWQISLCWDPGPLPPSLSTVGLWPGLQAALCPQMCSTVDLIMLLLLKTSSAFPFVRTHVFEWPSQTCFTFVSYLGLFVRLFAFGTLPLCSSLAFSSSQLRCSENPSLIPRLVQVLLFHLYLVCWNGLIMKLWNCLIMWLWLSPPLDYQCYKDPFVLFTMKSP